jgi:hypothetical protein
MRRNERSARSRICYNYNCELRHNEISQVALELGADPMPGEATVFSAFRAYKEESCQLGIKYQVQRLKKSVDAPCFSSAF